MRADACMHDIDTCINSAIPLFSREARKDNERCMQCMYR